LNDLPTLKAAFSNPLIGWQRLCGGRHERYLACGRPLLYFTPLLLLAQNPQPTPDQNSILNLYDAFGYQKQACGPALGATMHYTFSHGRKESLAGVVPEQLYFGGKTNSIEYSASRHSV